MQLKYIYILFSLLVPFCLVSQANISTQVHEQFLEKEFVDCIILMKAQANISDCNNEPSKEDKSSCVYQTLKLTASTSQNEIVSQLENLNVNYKSYFLINMLKAKLNKNMALTIANRDDVKSIIYNIPIKLSFPTEEKLVELRGEEPEWGIKMIGADSLWNLGYTGQGVVIAGQDTGYEWENELIKSKYRGFENGTAIHDYNWHDAIREIDPANGDSIIMDSNNDCGLNAAFPCDDHNHGTHTMGTMVGSAPDEKIGVAPGAKWIACRNMERGSGKPSTYIECFEWFLAPTKIDGSDPDPSLAPHVINNSWSCPASEGCNSDNWNLMYDAIQNLKTAGVVVIVSAGNNGPSCNTVNAAPAMLENSFSIGASADNDSIAGFSSRGPVDIDQSFRQKPEIVAPGRGVRSIIRNNQFASWSGTSMAGPHAAAAVALIISANPALAGEVQTIENILIQSSVQKTDSLDCNNILGNQIPNSIYGHGRLNVLKAVEIALGISSTQNDLTQNDAIQIFPNPGIDQMVIKNQTLEIMDVLIYNASGQLLDKIILDTKETKMLQMRDKISGSYFYRWNTSSISGTGKWIKN